MRGHDATCGPLRCVKDHRSKLEKLEDMAAAPSASQGERDNARKMAAAERAKNPPTGPKITDREPYRPPTGPAAQPAGTQRRPITNDPPFERWFQFGADDWAFRRTPPTSYDDAMRDALRQAQARETLRRTGFVTPDDAGFESEFTSRAAGASETFRRASRDFNDLRDKMSKMSSEELFQFFNDQTSRRSNGPAE